MAYTVHTTDEAKQIAQIGLNIIQRTGKGQQSNEQKRD